MLKHKTRLILSIVIFIVLLGYFAVDRFGYIEQLPASVALTVGLALVFAGGVVAGATGFYLWICWKVKRRSSRTEEHAT